MQVQLQGYLWMVEMKCPVDTRREVCCCFEDVE